VKLPAISLPQFESWYETWATFSDSFKNIIHRKDNIAAVHRFHYLRSALIVEVLQVFQNLPMTKVNCMISWELLEERYQSRG
jgi:hypothetical protein